jgi:hypothetical protein
MSSAPAGQDSRPPAGYTVIAADTALLRGHHPDRDPAWFGPEVGRNCTQRFDLPHRARAEDPGICYFATSLECVLLERVLRDVMRPVISIATVRHRHALSQARTTRALLLFDLVTTPWTVWGVQLSDLAARPPYGATQVLAMRLASVAPIAYGGETTRAADGILYASRFGAGHTCIALWDRAAPALDWRPLGPLDSDLNALAGAASTLGVGLID